MLNTCRAGASAIGQNMSQTLDTWFAEWAASRREAWRPGPQALLCSPASKSWQDFLVWTYAKMHERKRYTGLYIHDSLPVFSDNLYAGGGVEESGNVYPKWTLLGTREMLKRLYAMLRLKEPKGSVRLNLHGRLLAPLMGFCDMVVDGEGLDSKLSLASPAMSGHLSPDTFRAQYLGTNFGPFCWWTPPNAIALEACLSPGRPPEQVYPDPDREARWLAGMALVHRAAINPVHVPGRLTGLLKALEAYGLSSDGCRFIGYWSDPPGRVDPPREGILISAYLAKQAENPPEPGKAVLVVLNNTDWEGDLRLALDWDKLGMRSEGAKLEDALSGQSLRQENGQILLPVKRRDICLIGIRQGP
jgi:hypothetical protein